MKKYDPHMHTAEHILNQTMVRMFNISRSFSSHLERKKSKCDYVFDRALTPEEEKAISEKVNEQLQRNLPVGEYWLHRDEAVKNFNLQKLPGNADGQIRIVTIGDYDACPCIGEHVSNTAEIGEFVLGSTSYDDGVLRVRFRLKQP